MALNLEQYASYLDTRGLPWPAAPDVGRPKAKPHLVRLPGIRVVLWNVYGTLLNISGGELYFQHPLDMLMDVALEKTVQEFKMWGAMSRKPGQPAEYLKHLYAQALDEQHGVAEGKGSRRELLAERVWESLVKKLLQKEYKFDAGFYGALNELSQKIAYFFHASLQGTACYPGGAAALGAVVQAGARSGVLGDGQCFTAVQLRRGLAAQEPDANFDVLLPRVFRFLSCDAGVRKPSERLFRQALGQLAGMKIAPGEVLHVGSSLSRDLAPARRFGMKTALFAGDKASLQASAEQLKDAAAKPDVLLTELGQIAEVLP